MDQTAGVYDSFQTVARIMGQASAGCKEPKSGRPGVLARAAGPHASPSTGQSLANAIFASWARSTNGSPLTSTAAIVIVPPTNAHGYWPG